MISSRLRFISSLISPVEVIADIGSDHGYIPADLLKNDIAKKIIATDISAPSVQKAIDLMEKLNLSEKSDFRVGNGLEVLNVDEADTVIIAGMGGKLICEILQNGYKNKFKEKIPTLVLQPVQQVGDLRYFLIKNDFDILDEHIFVDQGKVYQVMISRKINSEKTHSLYKIDLNNQVQIKYGTINIKKKSQVLISQLEREYDKLNALIEKLELNNIEKELIESKKIYLYQLEKVRYEISKS
ncbi:tRNA (adenine(22)-N(1))-methyltransferase [Criibacterium bergeronii]|uniref:SAM-dependent methyltransferase n=1 Tax=Criibacterium bergeronii TaxID=1871336 RepID=A0A371IJX1_9FIRM|nr:class I SAM-dependent methyltransferase [Criibacterium bergeronii]RDY20760.1 SAM-dependent methyltransferase [Criibacterium bergeronii]